MCCPRLVPKQMASSSDSKKGLVVVELETFLLARYRMPDLPLSEAENLFKEIKGRKFGYASLSLANVQQSVLVIPTRIINKIYVDGVERWVCPA